jgi:plastocyanin
MYFSKTTIALLQAASALAATHKVNVGGNKQLIFTPTSVTAQPGDTVQFVFLDQNHTATAGNPNQGCTPSGMFNSGFVPVPSASAAATAATAATAGKKQNGRRFAAHWDLDLRAAGGKPTFSVPIKNTNPITVYCAQATHCQAGMVSPTSFLPPWLFWLEPHVLTFHS